VLLHQRIVENVFLDVKHSWPDFLAPLQSPKYGLQTMRRPPHLLKKKKIKNKTCIPGLEDPHALAFFNEAHVH
jgi:hypothetical protein